MGGDSPDTATFSSFPAYSALKMALMKASEERRRCRFLPGLFFTVMLPSCVHASREGVVAVCRHHWHQTSLNTYKCPRIPRAPVSLLQPVLLGWHAFAMQGQQCSSADNQVQAEVRVWQRCLHVTTSCTNLVSKLVLGNNEHRACNKWVTVF
jgi:hypothetical protein